MSGILGPIEEMKIEEEIKLDMRGVVSEDMSLYKPTKLIKQGNSAGGSNGKVGLKK